MCLYIFLGVIFTLITVSIFVFYKEDIFDTHYQSLMEINMFTILGGLIGGVIWPVTLVSILMYLFIKLIEKIKNKYMKGENNV